MKSRHVAYITAALGSLFCCTATAPANGILRWGHGAEDTGAAGAFARTHGNAIAALQANPALLSTLDSGQVSASLRYLDGDATFRRSRTATNAHLVDDDGLYPDVAFAYRPSGSDWTFGVGASPISGLRATWNYLDAPGGIGGISYGEISHRSEFRVLRLAAAASFQATDRLSLGLSAGAVQSEVGFHAPFIFQTNAALAGAKVDLDLETEDWAPSIELGAHYRLNDDISLGLHLRAPIPLSGRGTADVDFSEQLPALGLAPANTAGSYDAATRNTLPLTIAAAASWQATDRIRLGASLEWIRWSNAYDDFPVRLSNGDNAEINAAIGSDLRDSVPLDWSDRLVISLGAEYAISPVWTVRGGWRYAKSPIPQALVTPLNGAILEHVLAAGLSWKGAAWQVDLAIAHEFSTGANIDISGYNAGEYSASSLDVAITHISVGATRRF